MSTIIIDEKEYIEIPETEFPFGNVCRKCAFYGTACYDRDDYTCHSDSRADGIGVVFKEAANNSLHQMRSSSRL
uniref:Uncharacterized protein n=1 Tax=viral metagenome TaxID=1070528 RepID=A0A6H2A329_9ZZZZ